MINIYDDIKNTLLNIDSNLTDEYDDFIEAGILDSFLLVEVISEIEEKYDIEIDVKYVKPENFKNTKTIAALVEKIILEEKASDK